MSIWGTLAFYAKQGFAGLRVAVSGAHIAEHNVQYEKAGAVVGQQDFGQSTAENNSLNWAAISLLTLLGMLAAAPAQAAVDVLISNLSDTPDPAPRGGDVIYTIVVANNGNDPASNVTVTVPLPATTTYQDASIVGGTCPAAGSVAPGGTVVCSLSANLAGGGSSTMTLRLRTTAATASTINIAATTATSSVESNSGNNTATQNTTINNGADLELSSVVGSPDPVTGGGNISWSMGGQNLGPDAANTPRVTLTLPASLSFVAAGSGGAGFSCSASGQLVTCTRSTPLALNESFSGLNIVTRVHDVSSGTATIAPQLSSAVADPFSSNNVRSASVQVNAGADLTISQAAPSPSPANPGNPVTFTVLPSNQGPSSATNGVTVTYNLPAGFVYNSSASSSGSWACAPSGQVVTCQHPTTFAAGASDQIQIVATAPAVTQLETYNNISAVIAHNPGNPADPNPGNNSASVNLNVMPAGAGLTVAKSRSPNPVAAGQDVVNTITVANQGSSAAPANSISVVDTIQLADETFVSYSGTGWVCTPAGSGGGNTLDAGANAATCRYTAALPAGQTAPALRIITRVASGHASGVAVNNANISCVSPGSGQPVPDCWYPAGQSVNANVSVSQTANSINLAMAKTARTANNDATLDASETVMTYTLTVSNIGAVDAQNIVVRDPIPGHRSDTPDVAAATTYATASSATFSCAMDNAALVCTQTGGVLAVGQNVTFTVPVERNLTGGSFTNTASVSSTTQGDTDTSNNSASVPVVIVPITDVEMVSKIVTPATAQAGTNVTYVLSFRNNGPSPAQNVQVRDQFVLAATDPGFTVISVNAANWTSGAPTCSGLEAGRSYGPGSNPLLNCQGGNLASGEQRTITIVLRPNWKSGQASGTSWSINNTARIDTSTAENADTTNGANNSKSAVLLVEAADIDLLVNNIDNVDPLGYDPSNNGDNPQNDVIYTINLVNNGPSQATGVRFTYRITPPNGKTLRFLGDSASMGPPAGSICNNIGSEVTGPASLLVTCTYTGAQASMENAEVRNRYLSVRLKSEPAVGGDVYNSVAEVFANENDRNLGNNTEGEATTVRSDISPNNLSLSGRVFVDVNDNGQIDSGEVGISGVTVTLSGTTATGGDVCLVAQCVVQTGADGRYSFTGLPPSNGSGYTIVETQPAGYTNGKNQVGSQGAQGGNPPRTVLPAGSDTFVVVLNNSGTDYNFGELAAAIGSASISGHVWLDGDHDRVYNSSSPAAEDRPQADWLVELWRNGSLVTSMTTAANGAYSFTNLPPGSGYQVKFIHPTTGTLYGHARPNEQGLGYDNGQVHPISNPTGASNLDGSLSGITLNNGDNILGHSLPLDPAGVVYDAVTRQPVSGAVVRISGPAGFTPALHLVGGQDRHTTAGDGGYQFLLNQNAPAGVYTLSIDSYPANYLPQPSAMLPVCQATLQVTATPDPAMVQQNATAPAVGAGPVDASTCASSSADGSFANNSTGLAAAATRHYFSFNLQPGVSANLVNNHIPLDPMLGGIITVTKVTPLVNVVRGDLVPYTITASSSVAINNIDVTDRLPPGFKYRSGSASINGVRIEPEVNGRDLSWKNQSFTAGERKTYKLILVVGTGVGEGEYINQAWAQNALVNTLVSNIGSAPVKVTPDPTFDCSDIIGKVFDDKNANGYQDQGEPGIANVRVVTARGLLVTTDAEGRFHVTCADIPQMDRGSNFVMKLDERTLPSGYRVTTENPRDVRVTRGKMVKLNFGATVHRVVRVDINDAAFLPAALELQPQWQQAFEDMLHKLEGRPSVLRIAYAANANDKAQPSLTKKRLDNLAKLARKRWREMHEKPNQQQEQAAFPLIVETAVEAVEGETQP